ncbi:TB182 protein, partial [Centropus unirufus]|nr:TB182 protein [Centropus unirufus]
LAPGSPESPAQPPATVLATSIPAPGAPSSSSTARLSTSRSPGSPHIPGEGSPDSASPPGTPTLPPRAAGPPGSPEGAERPGAPSPTLEPAANATGPPGSPEPPKPPEGPNSSPASRHLGHQGALEQGLWPLGVGQELGGSVGTRPLEPLEPSQPPEGPMPLRGSQQAVSTPSCPVPEVASLGVSTEESDREDPNPCTLHPQWDGGAEGAGSRGAEGAPCPGGPVGQPEEEEEEGEAEQDGSVPRSPLCVPEPGWDLAEPETPAQPSLIIPAAQDPPDMATTSNSAWPLAGDSPGGPGQAEASLGGPDPHADPGWLTELLASPGSHAVRRRSPEGPEDLLGWSRKDLRSEFGVSSPRHAGAFDWTREAAARESRWASETEQNRKFGTKSSWDSTRDQQDRAFGPSRQDWGSGDRGTERTGEARLGCADWSGSHSTRESCPQDPGFGAGQARWGMGYGLAGEDMGTRKDAWSGSYSAGYSQQQDQEPSWAGGYGAGHTETQDRELAPDRASKFGGSDAGTRDKDFTLGWAGRSSTGDVESQDQEFGPRRPDQDGKYSAKDMESQDREFSPSRPAWDSKYSTKDMGTRDQELSPHRPAWPSEHSTRDAESQESRFGASGPVWGDRYSMRTAGAPDQECGPGRLAWESEHCSRDTESQETLGPGRLSSVGERGPAQAELGGAFAVGSDASPDPSARDPGWSGSVTAGRDWAAELGGAKCPSQFGVTGTEWVPDPPCTGALLDAGGMREGVPGGQHGGLSFGCAGTDARVGQPVWDEDVGSPAGCQDAAMGVPGWSTELLCDAETQRHEGASAFGTGEPSPRGDAGAAHGSPHPSDPCLPVGAAPPGPPAVEFPWHEPPGPSSQDRAPLSPGDTGSPGAPPDHPDGKGPAGWEEEQRSPGAPGPEGPPGQEFPFLEAVELLDLSASRRKAMLGRQRPHRAPSLRPGDADHPWLFRDCSGEPTARGSRARHRRPRSADPRPPAEPPATADEEEPRGRRLRPAPTGKGARVSLFPGLSAAAIK